MELSDFLQSFKQYFLIFLDISLVAYLFYRIYLILSKTRAVQLGLGIFIILVFAIIARLVELQAVTWLVENLTDVVVITVIVIMAPELRRLVAQISPGRLFSSVLPRTSLRLDEIVDALKSLSQEKTGAIIVLARQTGLNNYIEKGIRMEALISSELIRTIFNHKSPLHDGAVIIDGGLIAAAACYLPLSDSRQLKKTHGARHRAGLGIAEESDAVAIICSEETGRISLCVDARLISNVRMNYIKPILSELMSGQPDYQQLVDEGVNKEVAYKIVGEDALSQGEEQPEAKS